MKIINSEIIDLHSALSELKQTKASIRIHYNCLKSLQNCGKEIEIIESERKRICNELAKKDETDKAIIENNNYVFANKESESDAAQKIKELNSLETEIELFPLPKNEIDNILGGITGISLEILTKYIFTK